MTLLVFICNRPEKLDEVLEGFVELGITGATIVDSIGMGRILSRKVPIFVAWRRPPPWYNHSVQDAHPPNGEASCHESENRIL